MAKNVCVISCHAVCNPKIFFKKCTVNEPKFDPNSFLIQGKSLVKEITMKVMSCTLKIFFYLFCRKRELNLHDCKCLLCGEKKSQQYQQMLSMFYKFAFLRCTTFVRYI